MARHWGLRALLAVAALAPIAVWTTVATARDKAIPFKVVYEGKGTWSRNAKYQYSLCDHVQTSDEHSNFTWTVTWPRVVITPGNGSFEIAKSPRGALKIQWRQKSTEKDSCAPPADPSCDVASTATAPEAQYGYLDGVGYRPPRRRRAFFLMQLDADASPPYPDVGCPIVAPDRTQHLLIYVDNFGFDRDKGVVSPLQAGLVVAGADFERFGKQIFFVHKSESNPPAADYACGPALSGVTCSENQDWSGTVTLTRLKK